MRPSIMLRIKPSGIGYLSSTLTKAIEVSWQNRSFQELREDPRLLHQSASELTLSTHSSTGKVAERTLLLQMLLSKKVFWTLQNETWPPSSPASLMNAFLNPSDLPSHAAFPWLSGRDITEKHMTSNQDLHPLFSGDLFNNLQILLWVFAYSRIYCYWAIGTTCKQNPFYFAWPHQETFR